MWNYYPIIADFKSLTRDGRLRYCYGTPGVNNAIILGISDRKTRLYGANEIKPTSIVFYGGYISK